MFANHLIALSGCRVFINDEGLIFDASLNFSEAGKNHNKFYRVQVLQTSTGDYNTWTRWGRVGERGQNKLLGDGSLGNALYQFDKKFKEKSGHPWANRLDPPKGGKYTFIERSYEDSDDEEPASQTR